MRIGVIAPGAVPAAVGGAERLYEGLVRAFNDETPHTAELVMVPSPEHSFRQLVDSYDAFRRLDVSQFDLVVSTKYPSWMVRHDRHVVYMLHTLRGLYDTYHYTGLPTHVASAEPEAQALVDILRSTPPGTTTSGAERVLATARWVVDSLGDDHPACVFPGPLIRALVHWLDRDALDATRVRAHFAISQRVTERPDYFPPGVRPLSLPPPTALEGLVPGPYETFFTASRLDGPKRIELLIAAMQLATADVPLRIAGTGPDESRLRDLAAGNDRIEFLGRISEDELRAEYSRALAVPFVPLDEDFGLVAVEAQLAAKPVVTCRDSGGVTGLVEHQKSGLVVEPDPAAIAHALDELATDPARAEAMGKAGAEAVRSITWEAVTSNIIDGAQRTAGPKPTAETDRTRAPRFAVRRRQRLVVLSTYPAAPARGGGQLRLNRLVRGLGRRFDIEVVTLDDAGGIPGVNEIAPHVQQTVIAKGEEHRQFEGALAARSPIPIGDISATLFVQHTPEYIAALRDAARGASGAILEQPYLLPALLRAAPDLPFVYDSQNAEAIMKAEILRDSPGSAALVAVVEAVERAAVQGAALVATCSREDRLRLEGAMPTLAPWTLVPNGADVFDTPFCTGEERRANRARMIDALNGRLGRDFENLAVFVASYHPPNLTAAELIVDAATQVPHTAFVLAGSHSDHFLNWRLPPNVVPLGVVSDRALRQLLRAADVALNPMQSGGGTNLKLIEYFAVGAPVVSSALGTRGLADDVRDLVLTAETADDLVRAIRDVLTDADTASQRARRAREFAEQNYDWATIAERFGDDLAQVLSAGVIDR